MSNHATTTIPKQDWAVVGNYSFLSNNPAAIPTAEQVDRAEQMTNRAFANLGMPERSHKVVQLAMAMRSNELLRNKVALAPAQTTVKSDTMDFTVHSAFHEGNMEHTVNAPLSGDEAS